MSSPGPNRQQRRAAQPADLEFDADAGDRIMAALAQVEVRSQLEPAARLAGEQLELMKPGVMIPTAKGLWAGVVADVPLGQMVFVLADRQRVATFYCGLRAGVTAQAAIDRMVAEATAAGAAEEGESADLANIIRAILEHVGAKPGEERPDTIGDAELMLGALLSAIPAEVRAKLANVIDRCTEAAICPVVVGLIGPASSGRPDYHSIVWPLFLPLAPYLDWVMHKADPTETVQ